MKIAYNNLRTALLEELNDAKEADVNDLIQLVNVMIGLDGLENAQVVHQQYVESNMEAQLRATAQAQDEDTPDAVKPMFTCIAKILYAERLDAARFKNLCTFEQHCTNVEMYFHAENFANAITPGHDSYDRDIERWFFNLDNQKYQLTQGRNRVSVIRDWVSDTTKIDRDDLQQRFSRSVTLRDLVDSLGYAALMTAPLNLLSR